MEPWRALADALDSHPRSALITVAATRGSAPREAGARIIVMPDGGFRGTIGGGTLEWQALAAARRAMAQRAPSLNLERCVLGPDMGQCCGGSVTLLTEIFDASSRAEIDAFAVRAAASPFATEGEIGRATVNRRVLEGVPCGVAAKLVDGGTRIRECFGLRQHPVYVFGAGHVGRALMLALAALPFSVSWVDAREDAFPAVMPANVRALRAADPGSVLPQAPKGSFVVVMTHSHALDLQIVDAALRAKRFAYVGLIGSASKRARFNRMMRSAGLAAEDIGALVCPIGVAGINSKQPAAIASAVTAQLLMRLEHIEGSSGAEVGA